MAKIIVADDTQSVRFLISSIVAEEGHIVFEAKNGLEALHTYFQVNPDLIITDYQMPELDGYSLIQEILKVNPSAKFIICTGGSAPINPMPFNIPVIQKPFNIENLVNAIKSTLGKTACNASHT